MAYDGTDFLGFQLQAGGRTVQGTLEAAVARVTEAGASSAVRVVGSGRTDAGVHAQGQVIGFRAPWRHAVPDLQRALNAVLPQDVAVVELGLAEEDWHPRFSARRRHYRYTILNQSLRSPLDRLYAHWVAGALDVSAMQAAAGDAIGVHDFASFGRPMQSSGAARAGSTVREVLSADWHSEARWVIFDVVGNAFLRSMVRSLVGSLLYVGLGLWPVEGFKTVLEARDRALAAPPAPACGLCLMQVDYD